MAIEMKTFLVDQVLASMLQDSPDVIAKVKYLKSNHAIVGFGLFTFSIKFETVSKHHGKVYQVTLPHMPSKFDTLSPSTKALMVKKVVETVESAIIGIHVDGPGPAPEVPASESEVQEAPEPVYDGPKKKPDWMSAPPSMKEKMAAGKVKQVKKVVKPTAKTEDASTPAAPSDGKVVKLKDARSLAQKVKGTSPGSEYRVAAVGVVNLAVKGMSPMSIRAEFQHDKVEEVVINLTAMGFVDHGEYLSMHLHTSGTASPMRVLGSVLLGAQVKFDQIATTLEQING